MNKRPSSHDSMTGSTRIKDAKSSIASKSGSSFPKQRLKGRNLNAKKPEGNQDGQEALVVEDAVGTTPGPIAAFNLVAALHYNVDLIYQWIASNVDYFPMWGVHKGPEGTLLDRIGGPVELTYMLGYLLQESDYECNYALGSIRLTKAELENLLGTDDSTVQTTSIDMLTAAQIPNIIPQYDDDGNLEYADFSHVWLQVTIDGEQYVFDPAYKSYNYSTGIDLGPIVDFDATTLISAAEEGATITSDSIQNLNSANITEAFTAYGTNLLNWIQTNNFSAGMQDIVGGRNLLAVSTEPLRQTSLPYQTPGSTPTFVTSLPSSYFATLQIQLGTLNKTFKTAEIYTARLILGFYPYDGSTDLLAELGLNSALIAEGEFYTAGTTVEVTFTVTHPFATDSFNDTWTQELYVDGAGLYLVANAWGPSSQTVADSHRWFMLQNNANYNDIGSEPVVGEAMGSFFAMKCGQWNQVQQICDQLGSSTHLLYHLVGVVGINNLYQAPYFDFGSTNLAVQSRIGNSDLAENVYFASEIIANGFDAAIFQQVVSATQGVNTQRMLDVGNTAGQVIYDANSSNWSTISADLVGWDSSQISTIGDLIADGYRIVIQQNGATEEGAFTGGGYYQILNGITGELSLGITSVPNEVVDANDMFNGIVSIPLQVNANAFQPLNNEGVGLGSGTLYYNRADFRVGSGNFPYSLPFTRYYNSDNYLVNGTLGLAWMHNYGTTIAKCSSGFRATGEFSPKEAAATIALAYVLIQIGLTDSSTLTEVLIASESSLWLMDQMTNNAVTISDSGNSRTYVLLIDGETFNQAPGYADTVTISDGNYTLTSLQQQQWNFNSSGNVSTYIDPAGVTVSYEYDDGLLASVSNGMNRTLYFTYNNAQLTTVSDGNGRSIAIDFNGYDGLIALTDANGNTINYGYSLGEFSAQLTEIDLPANAEYSPLISYVFDDNLPNHVQSQTTPESGFDSFNFYFTGWRNEVEDPLGNSEVRFCNSFGSVLIEINELEQQTSYVRDALNRLVSVTYPELNVLSFTYDNNNNVLTKTWQPKPGSSLPNIVHTFTYDPDWNKLASFTDGEDNTTTYTYDSVQGTLLTVTKPTVSSGTPTIQFTYNDRGQILTRTDETGIVDRFVYDDTTELLLSFTKDYGTGRSNLTTSFAYDDIGNITSITDPRGNATAFEYDNERHLVQQIDSTPFSHVTQWQYNANGWLVALMRPTGNLADPSQTWSWSYLASGNVSAITDPADNSLNLSYDLLARIQSRTDAEDRVYQYAYDEIGRLSTITDPLLNVPNTLTYTDNGLLASTEDANSNVTTYQYDGLDRLSVTTYPDETTEQYLYDLNNNVLTETMRNEATITNTYDALSRLSTRQPSTLAEQTLVYDLANRLLSVSIPVSGPGSGEYQFGYDTAGRLVSQTMPNLDVVTYQLDANGNRTQLIWPDGYYADYNYDQLNRLTDISLNGSSTASVEIEYDVLSRRSQLSFANGSSCTYSYALNNDLELQIQSFVGSSAAFGYSYNKVHQLLAPFIDDSDFIWQPSASATVAYSANNLNQYSAVGGTSYSYNTNGCLTGGLLSASYDVLNRITQAINGGTTDIYWYDPLNRQAQKGVSPGGFTVDTVTVGSQPYALAVTPDGTQAYVLNEGSSNVSVIDVATNIVTSTIDVDTFAESLAITPDGSKVYVVSPISSMVTVIDTSSNTISATISIGGESIQLAITPDGTSVYVSQTAANTVAVIDTATNIVTATVTVGTEPWGVAISPDGTKAYVANRITGDVSVIDTSTNSVIATIPVGTQPFFVTITPDGTQAYVPNTISDNTVSVIDTSTDTVIATVPVGFGPLRATITPDGTQVYVSNGSFNTVSVIDTTTNTVSATITVGGGPQPVAITSDGTMAYVPNYDSNTVSIINTSTNTVTATINVGAAPYAVALTPDGSQAYIANNSDVTVSVIETTFANTAFLYDGQQLISTYDDSGDLQNRYIKGDRLNEVFLYINGSTTTYLHTDRLGSVIAESNSSGAVLNKFAFSPFGESSSVSSSSFGFTGERSDYAIGLYNYLTRYYAPEIGRFLQPDSITCSAGDLNLYTYAGNDPLSSTEPTGVASVPLVPGAPSILSIGKSQSAALLAASPGIIPGSLTESYLANWFASEPTTSETTSADTAASRA